MVKDAIVMQSSGEHKATVIFSHGLGDSGHGMALPDRLTVVETVDIGSVVPSPEFGDLFGAVVWFGPMS
ncbi:hypothetical protein SARC_11954, partial [Sphaeroforma arctica JP610]